MCWDEPQLVGFLWLCLCADDVVVMLDFRFVVLCVWGLRRMRKLRWRCEGSRGWGEVVSVMMSWILIIQLVYYIKLKIKYILVFIFLLNFILTFYVYILYNLVSKFYKKNIFLILPHSLSNYYIKLMILYVFNSYTFVEFYF